MAVKIATKGAKPVMKTVEAKKAEPEKKSVISVGKIKAEAEKKAEKKPEKKPEAKVEKLKAVTPEVLPALKSKGSTAVVDPVIEEVRRAYRSFAQTWLDFALKINAVSESEAWKLHAETWSDFCSEEFPDITLGTISKFLRVAKDWGRALLEVRERRPDALLPTYEACYELSVHGDKVPKEELPKLRKDLLECKITRPELSRKLEPYRKPRVTRTHKFDREESKRIEKEIEKEVESRAEAVVDDKKMAHAIDRELASDIDATAVKLHDHVKYLVEHLPLLTSVVEKTTFNVVKLAEDAEKLQGLVEDYLTKIEKISA